MYKRTCNGTRLRAADKKLSFCIERGAIEPSWDRRSVRFICTPWRCCAGTIQSCICSNVALHSDSTFLRTVINPTFNSTTCTVSHCKKKDEQLQKTLCNFLHEITNLPTCTDSQREKNYFLQKSTNNEK